MTCHLRGDETGRYSPVRVEHIERTGVADRRHQPPALTQAPEATNAVGPPEVVDRGAQEGIRPGLGIVA